MIIVKSMWGMLRAINRLTPKTYDEMREAMEENLEKARYYADMHSRMAALLQKLLRARATQSPLPVV
jgi:vacuolar-type H+-ATPase subunit C/Vma6